MLQNPPVLENPPDPEEMSHSDILQSICDGGILSMRIRLIQRAVSIRLVTPENRMYTQAFVMNPGDPRQSMKYIYDPIGDIGDIEEGEIKERHYPEREFVEESLDYLKKILDRYAGKSFEILDLELQTWGEEEDIEEFRRHKRQFLTGFHDVVNEDLKVDYVFAVKYSGSEEDEDAVLEFLSKLEGPTELHFLPDKLYPDGTTLFLANVKNLEQWKNASLLYIHSDFIVDMDVKDYGHFNQCDIRPRLFKTRTVDQLVRRFCTNGTFEVYRVDSSTLNSRKLSEHLTSHFDSIGLNAYKHESGLRLNVNERIWEFFVPEGTTIRYNPDENQGNMVKIVFSVDATLFRIISATEKTEHKWTRQQSGRFLCHKRTLDEGETEFGVAVESSIEKSPVQALFHRMFEVFETFTEDTYFEKFELVLDTKLESVMDRETTILGQMQAIDSVYYTGPQVKRFIVKSEGSFDDMYDCFDFVRYFHGLPKELHFRSIYNDFRRFLFPWKYFKYWELIQKVTVDKPFLVTASSTWSEHFLPDLWTDVPKTHISTRRLSNEHADCIMRKMYTEKFKYCFIETSTRENDDILAFLKSIGFKEHETDPNTVVCIIPFPTYVNEFKVTRFSSRHFLFKAKRRPKESESSSDYQEVLVARHLLERRPRESDDQRIVVTQQSGRANRRNDERCACC